MLWFVYVWTHSYVGSAREGGGPCACLLIYIYVCIRTRHMTWVSTSPPTHRLCDRQRAVVLTIHQPSLEIYSLFDSLTLLSHGRLVYHGRADGDRRLCGGHHLCLCVCRVCGVPMWRIDNMMMSSRFPPHLIPSPVVRAHQPPSTPIHHTTQASSPISPPRRCSSPPPPPPTLPPLSMSTLPISPSASPRAPSPSSPLMKTALPTKRAAATTSGGWPPPPPWLAAGMGAATTSGGSPPPPPSPRRPSSTQTGTGSRRRGQGCWRP